MERQHSKQENVWPFSAPLPPPIRYSVIGLKHFILATLSIQQDMSKYFLPLLSSELTPLGMAKVVTKAVGSYSCGCRITRLPLQSVLDVHNPELDPV